MKRLRHLIAAIALLALPMAPRDATGHETDQYTVRLAVIEDSTDRLNEGFNRMLAAIAEEWKGGADEKAFAKRVFNRMGGRHYIDKYERWARNEPEIDVFWLDRGDSIYRGGPFWQTRVVFFFGLGPVIRLNDQLVGMDKIGHFLSTGWKYHKRHVRGDDEERVIALGQRSEAGIFGILTTGVFSNADLVANYEGYLFYRSLFEDDIVPGKPSIILWEGDGATIQRSFDWRDHVNAFWDEAINPGTYDGLLRKRVGRNLAQICSLWEASPEAFETPDRAALEQQYAHLDLRPSDFSLSDLCTAEEDSVRMASGADAH